MTVYYDYFEDFEHLFITSPDSPYEIIDFKYVVKLQKWEVTFDVFDMDYSEYRQIASILDDR